MHCAKTISSSSERPTLFSKDKKFLVIFFLCFAYPGWKNADEVVGIRVFNVLRFSIGCDKDDRIGHGILNLAWNIKNLEITKT